MTQHIWHTRADAAFLFPVVEEQAIHAARAESLAEPSESRFGYRIDDAEARLQWQAAQEEQEHAPGVASCASAIQRAAGAFETGASLQLERLTRLTSGLHSGMEHEPVPATVKVAMAEEQRREQDRVSG